MNLNVKEEGNKSRINECLMNSDEKSKVEITYKSIFYSDNKTQNSLIDDKTINNITIFSPQIIAELQSSSKQNKYENNIIKMSDTSLKLTENESTARKKEGENDSIRKSIFNINNNIINILNNINSNLGENKGGCKKDTVVKRLNFDAITVNSGRNKGENIGEIGRGKRGSDSSGINNIIESSETERKCKGSDVLLIRKDVEIQPDKVRSNNSVTDEYNSSNLNDMIKITDVDTEKQERKTGGLNMGRNFILNKIINKGMMLNRNKSMVEGGCNSGKIVGDVNKGKNVSKINSTFHNKNTLVIKENNGRTKKKINDIKIEGKTDKISTCCNKNTDVEKYYNSEIINRKNKLNKINSFFNREAVNKLKKNMNLNSELNCDSNANTVNLKEKSRKTLIKKLSAKTNSNNLELNQPNQPNNVSSLTTNDSKITQNTSIKFDESIKVKLKYKQNKMKEYFQRLLIEKKNNQSSTQNSLSNINRITCGGCNYNSNNTNDYNSNNSNNIEKSKVYNNNNNNTFNTYNSFNTKNNTNNNNNNNTNKHIIKRKLNINDLKSQYNKRSFTLSKNDSNLDGLFPIFNEKTEILTEKKGEKDVENVKKRESFGSLVNDKNELKSNGSSSYLMAFVNSNKTPSNKKRKFHTNIDLFYNQHSKSNTMNYNSVNNIWTTKKNDGGFSIGINNANYFSNNSPSTYKKASNDSNINSTNTKSTSNEYKLTLPLCSPISNVSNPAAKSNSKNTSNTNKTVIKMPLININGNVNQINNNNLSLKTDGKENEADFINKILSNSVRGINGVNLGGLSAFNKDIFKGFCGRIGDVLKNWEGGSGLSFNQNLGGNLNKSNKKLDLRKFTNEFSDYKEK